MEIRRTCCLGCGGFLFPASLRIEESAVLSTSYDVIVVGGGVIGASVAWRLGQSGRRVLLLERGRIGGEATRAAAGMLGAQLEVGEPGPFFHLCIESRRAYRAFAEELLDDTGVDVQLAHNGILHLASGEDEVAALQDRLSWQRDAGVRGDWWTAAEVQRSEPMVGRNLGAAFLPDDGNISAPLLARALGIAAAQRTEVVEGAEVHAIVPSPESVRVDTHHHSYVAEHVVVAAGAWSKPFLNQVGFDFPVYPAKGQMMSILPRRGHGLRHTVFSQHAYLVPKRDGTIVVGATEDHQSGYNRDVTVDALAYLAAALERIAPGLKDAAFEAAWMGHRPASPNGFPVIGPVPGNSRVMVAAGHFRNGVVLAPITAEMVAAHLDQQAWSTTWQAFLPEQAVIRGN